MAPEFYLPEKKWEGIHEKYFYETLKAMNLKEPTPFPKCYVSEPVYKELKKELLTCELETAERYAKNKPPPNLQDDYGLDQFADRIFDLLRQILMIPGYQNYKDALRCVSDKVGKYFEGGSILDVGMLKFLENENAGALLSVHEMNFWEKVSDLKSEVKALNNNHRHSSAKANRFLIKKS
ncbi:hypothetical protein MHBO_002928 [Bonamia ostreae]|uniref:Uncharacterized protein n=1 Tax=Bonamia ostreae TaxID=126728 RepID=A0ABV2APY6_9EUKA